MKTTGKKHGSLGRRALSLALAAVVAIGSLGLSGVVLHQSAQEVYAKDIGSKNEVAKQGCEGNPAPSWQDEKNSNSENSPSAADGYTPVPGTTGEYYYKHPKDGTTGAEIDGVWTGGNAHSATGTIGGWTDSDINDFQSVLPFGTIYVDPTKLYDTTIKHKNPQYSSRTWKTWYGDMAAYPFTEGTTITLMLGSKAPDDAP